MNSAGIFRKIFHPHCGFSDQQSDFLQRCHPFQGFPIYTNNHPSGGSPLAPAHFLGGKMERMPSTCAMGLALECFQKVIPSKGMSFWKIFPTTRHSFHVREPVRKATLNGPKRLRIRVVFGIRELLRRFGTFGLQK